MDAFVSEKKKKIIFRNSQEEKTPIGVTPHTNMSQVLLDIFISFCAFGAGRRRQLDKTCTEMDSAKFIKLCRECSLLDATFTKTEADLLFSKSKGIRERKVTWPIFVDMFCEIARRRGLAPEDLENVAVRSGGRPKHVVRESTTTLTAVGSYIQPLKGEDLPSTVGRVLPWESPNWGAAPLSPAVSSLWRPGGTAPSSYNDPKNIRIDYPSEELILQQMLSRRHRSATPRARARRSLMSPPPAGTNTSHIKDVKAPLGQVVGSIGTPLRGSRLPKEIGRVLPWENPNWRALPQNPDFVPSPTPRHWM